MVNAFENAITEISERAFEVLDTMSQSAFDNIVHGAELMRDEILAALDEVGVIAEDSFILLSDTFRAQSEEISQTFTDMLEDIFVSFADTFQEHVMDVMVAGFEDAFDRITDQTVGFIRDLDKRFTDFAKEFARTIATSMLLSMTFVTDAVRTIEDELTTITDKLEKLAGVMRRAAEAQAAATKQAERATVEELEETRKRYEDLPTRFQLLAKYIDHPSWTKGRNLEEVIGQLSAIKSSVDALNVVRPPSQRRGIDYAQRAAEYRRAIVEGLGGPF